MAKSARASTKKSSRSRIRNTVYAPVEQARLERLSARLLASIAQSTAPRPTTGDRMEEDDLVDAANRQEQHTEDQALKAAQQLDSAASTNMDVDESSNSRASASKPKASSHKISKRSRKSNAKSIVFNTRKRSTKKGKASKGSKGSKGTRK